MNTKGPSLFRQTLQVLVICLLLASCTPATQIVIPPTSSSPESSSENKEITYLDQPSYNPEQANYYDLINRTFNLTPEEITLLKKNGFAITDRIAFQNFTEAYAYIYWKDLPVLITTDSILNAIHVTYDDLLERTEELILKPKLKGLLSQSLIQLQQTASADTSPDMAPIYRDLETYLTVPLALLDEKTVISPEADEFLKLAIAAEQPADVELFGGKRTIDFTLFKPRGHYNQTEELKQYFRAMSWLAQIDFRLVEYDRGGNPQLNLSHLVAATLLYQVLDQAGQRPVWDEFNSLIATFVGPSDNTTIPDLERFLADAGVKTPQDVLHSPNPAKFLELLTSGNYGQQQIAAQILFSNTKTSTSVKLPVSFAFLGQSFTVDSYVMSNLTFDRLIVEGKKIQRPFPSTLDVMYVLGNDRAKSHLVVDLARYHYQSNLAELRQMVNNFPPNYWESSTHNRWLDMLRALNIDTTDASYPQAMRTAAWADKTLHTQLSSWAQLRRDNILYAKQSTTALPLCSYPAGYVEPYPRFYAKIKDYAQAGSTLFQAIDPNSIDSGSGAQYLRSTAITYFNNLEIVAGRLQSLAEKELRLESFSKEDEAFLKNTAVRQVESVDTGCAGIVSIQSWGGWYPSLLPWEDTSPAVIADIHSNLNTDPSYPSLFPPGVLHVGTGSVAGLLFIVDSNEGPCMYIGPAFTFYETIEKGFPPTRLTDETWQERLNTDPVPLPPIWTRDFRLPSSHPPVYLSWPTP